MFRAQIVPVMNHVCMLLGRFDFYEQMEALLYDSTSDLIPL